ncbi:MAG: TatD family deoxyribonuclease [Bacteroidia bacterium]|nr:MAG: TatD family deoxyribonuclease [Bacteroidia bacterium]
MLIDTHSHIYSNEFEGYEKQMMENALLANVQMILMPAIDSETHENMLALEQRYPANVKTMMGVHPCSIKADWEKEIALAKEYLFKGRFIAVGEIGLDFYWDISFKEQQIEAFRTQLGWAVELGLPVSIHTRNATDESIEIVSEFKGTGLKGVFHCFGGTVVQAQKIIEMGFYLGIGGVVSFKKSDLGEVLKSISLSHIVLETDAPYLAPVPFRGKRNEPAYIPYIVNKLSEIYQLSPEMIAEQTTINAKTLFKLK